MLTLSSTSRRVLYGILLLSFPAVAQKPVIGSIVNAASMVPQDRPAHGVARGSIATIFGQNLAIGAAAGESYPLPTSLNGTSVTVGGIPAPLFYASPTQINFQVPSSLSPHPNNYVYEHFPVVVTTSAGKSDPANVDVYNKGFGIFTLDGTGCGRGAVWNVNSDGTMSLNSPANSVSPGSYVTLWGTGLGPVDNAPLDGTAAPLEPLALAQSAPPGAVLFGLFWEVYTQFGAVKVPFAGRAPGLAGVDQVNVLIPEGLPEGCSVPLSYDGWLQSYVVLGGRGKPVYLGATVPMSVHSGGGQCVDSSSNGLGQILLKRSVVVNDNTVAESDSLLASFSASPYLKLDSPPVSSSNQLAAQATSLCPQPGYTMLDAGSLSIAGAFGTRTQGQASVRNGAYQVILPSGSIQGGTFAVSSSGGKDLTSFQTSLQIPDGIQIASTYPIGTNILTAGSPQQVKSFGVTWAGGVTGQVVSLKLILHRAGDGDIAYYVARAPATQGSVAFEPSCTGTLNPICSLPFDGSPDAELVVEYGPDPAALPTFSAGGLRLGGLAGWVYEYRFIGLSVQ